MGQQQQARSFSRQASRWFHPKAYALKIGTGYLCVDFREVWGHLNLVMRTRRIKVTDSSAVYHCISRIVGAEFLLEGEREKEVLRNQIWKVADFCGVEILTYCIMSNHVHLLVRVPPPSSLARIPNSELSRRVKRIYAPEKAAAFAEGLSSSEADERERFRSQLVTRMGDLSQFMKELKQRFSIWYNRNHGRLGTLWAERFKSVLIEDESMALSTVAAYIDLNPVRAGLVSDPADYRYCGYAEAMGGHSLARRGISSLFGHRGAWASNVSIYRIVLFGKGQSSPASGQGASVSPGKAAQVMSEGGKVSREEALRCRIRYFSDGAVLGSKEFVQKCLESTMPPANRQRARAGPRELKGSDWNGLNCLRGLRSQVFGSAPQ